MAPSASLQWAGESGNRCRLKQKICRSSPRIALKRKLASQRFPGVGGRAHAVVSLVRPGLAYGERGRATSLDTAAISNAACPTTSLKAIDSRMRPMKKTIIVFALFQASMAAAVAGTAPSSGHPIETPQYIDQQKCAAHPDECQPSRKCQRWAWRCESISPQTGKCLVGKRVCIR